MTESSRKVITGNIFKTNDEPDIVASKSQVTKDFSAQKKSFNSPSFAPDFQGGPSIIPVGRPS